MPPARRKRGAAAAASAAAAAAQWKVGDLVLAKMKGFPAWPAKISDPQEWGLDAARKKLLVYFYGTKQIAFCNYADLEAFTEEKKKCLLAKRYGKGADFVRAVKEIVEIYDSLKTENNDKICLTKNSGSPNVENLVNNSSSLDTGGHDDGSNLVNDNKMADPSTSSMDHSMVSAPGPNIVTVDSERCAVNSANGEPIEKLPVLGELRNSSMHASPCSKKVQKDSQQQDSCTLSNFTSPRRSRSLSGAKLRTSQDSSGLVNGTNLPSVDLIPGGKQEDSAQHKCVDDDKPNTPSSTKEVALLHSSPGTCSQHEASQSSTDDKKQSIGTEDVQNTCIRVPQTGIQDKEVRLNGAHDPPMSTTLTFKRKRRTNTLPANKPTSEVTDMDSGSQPRSSGNLSDSPNSSNEITKSDGDEHLPLVKRARVRMERPQLDNAVVDEPDDSYNKTEPDEHVCVDEHDDSYNKTEPAENVDHYYKSSISAPYGKDHSADEASPEIDPSPKIDLTSREVQIACNNIQYQSKVLALDVEAALPPSKRLHRALEAMSANASETVSNLPEVTKSEVIILKGYTPSIARSASNNSADTLVESPKSAITKSFEVCLTAHPLEAPTGQKHISQPSMLNKDSPCTVSPDLKNDVGNSQPKDKVSEGSHMDSESIPDLFVHTRIDNDICGKAPIYSVKVKEPAIASMSDKPHLPKASGHEPVESIDGSTNDFCKNIDSAAESLSQTNTGVSDTSGRSCNHVPHDETVLVEPMVNIYDTRSPSSLVSKVSCIRSDASTRTFEAHSSSIIAPEELNHSLNLPDKSLSAVSMPMKELVADGHALSFSRSNSFMDIFLDSKAISESLVNTPSVKEGSSDRCSPSTRTIRSASDRIHTQESSGKILFDNLQPKGLNKLAGRNEVNSARRAFEAFVGTLTRTKESIARATRLALDCAKHGIAGEVMDIIIEHLEKETNLYKRVDLFFLVDSIIQHCRNQRGGPGDAYPSLIQAVLPRIIYASAPPGNSSWENRRQCLKVLRLWLERKTLSEYIIRHHIKELEALNDASFGTSHRPSGTERALNDPLRDDEAFLVDEYGSNAGIHLPDLLCTKLLEDEEGRFSEERSFEAVTPEEEVTGANEQDASQLHSAKHQLILEEVDGELEMEDAAPSSGAEATSTCEQDLTNTSCTGTAQHLNSIPPLPDDKPPSPPPLPSSPPPLPRPPCPVSQGSQVHGALPVSSDHIEQHRPGAIYNIESQQPNSVASNRGNMDACVASLQPPISYNSGYVGHTNQIFPPPPPPPLPPRPPQPVAPFHPPGPHGNFCGPSIPHHGNNYHQPPSATPPNNAYHLQPPLHPPAPNQFPYPPEPEQRAQPWNYNPCFPERYPYGGHDRGQHEYDRRHQFDDRGQHFNDRGHHFNGGGHCFGDGRHPFDDRWNHFHDRGPHFNDAAVIGQMPHGIIDGGRFPPFFPPGPPFPDHFEGPPNPLPCGRPSDPPTGPCSGWSMPDRRSKYPPASRHSMEPSMSHGGWRRGRRDYDR